MLATSSELTQDVSFTHITIETLAENSWNVLLSILHHLANQIWPEMCVWRTDQDNSSLEASPSMPKADEPLPPPPDEHDTPGSSEGGNWMLLRITIAAALGRYTFPFPAAGAWDQPWELLFYKFWENSEKSQIQSMVSKRDCNSRSSHNPTKGASIRIAKETRSSSIPVPVVGSYEPLFAAIMS